ncbi:phage holin family protein [Nesterenkonia lutea]|uniref:Flp pilus assembly protein TadB n=1 Tax=Nesterenkonia lutea TaxID=272919 RepID=A0ABR9JEU9_9MICC|nr:phage holin family protein [Nesterenkonia lutea]MBE1524463.1 Flp pilus assembly protein TadB [Nesterenkonia lutea]
MSQPETGRTTSTAPRTSLLDMIKVVLRLGPKQISDEIQLAIGQMKTKGVAAGVAVALMVVGAVFVAFLVVALIIAAVAALALIFQPWAAALIVAGIFLIIALIFVLIGLRKFKKTMPLLPEDAIRGLRLDLGVAREGTSFDPASLEREDAERRREKEESKRQAAEQAKKDAKTPGAGKPAEPSYSELLRRTALRREHLATLQDQITTGSRHIGETVREKTSRDKPARTKTKTKTKSASPKVRAPRERRRDTPRQTAPGQPPAAQTPKGQPRAGQTAPGRPASGQESGAHAAGDFVAARWKPLAVVAGSAAAGAVFLRELVKK